MTDSTRLIGRLFGSPEDIPILKELGVEGDLHYDPDTKTINCCIITPEVLEKLTTEFYVQSDIQSYTVACSKVV